jgi:hypothetical protein
MPFRDLINYPLIYDEYFNAIICDIILSTEENIETATDHCLKAFPDLFKPSHKSFVLGCSLLKSKNVSKNSDLLPQSSFNDSQIITSRSEKDFFLGDYKEDSTKFIDQHSHDSRISKANAKIHEITKNMLLIVRSLSLFNLRTLLASYQDIGIIEDFFKILGAKIISLKKDARKIKNDQRANQVNSNLEEELTDIKEIRKTRLHNIREFCVNLLFELHGQIKDMTRPVKVIEQTVRRMRFMNFFNESTEQNINKFLSKFCPRNRSEDENQSLFSKFKEEEVRDQFPKALNAGLAINDKKITRLILEFALKEGVFTSIKVLNKHNVISIEKHFDQMNLNRASINYLFSICQKGDGDNLVLAGLAEKIAEKLFYEGESLFLRERLDFLCKAQQYLEKVNDPNATLTRTKLLQKIYNCELQVYIEEELKNRSKTEKEFSMPLDEMRKVCTRLLDEETLLNEFVGPYSLYLAYSIFLIKTSSKKLEAIQTSILSMITYYQKNEKDSWPFNLKNSFDRLREIPGFKYILMDWTAIICNIELCNHEFPNFSKILNNIDLYKTYINSLTKENPNETIREILKDRRESEQHSVLEFESIPKISELDPFWLPVFLKSRSLIPSHQVFEIYSTLFGKFSQKEITSFEDLLLIYRFGYDLLLWIRLWFETWTQTKSQDESPHLKEVSILFSNLTKIESAVVKTEKYFISNSIMMDGEMMIELLMTKRDQILSLVEDMRVWAREEKKEKILSNDISRSQYGSHKKLS